MNDHVKNNGVLVFLKKKFILLQDIPLEVNKKGVRILEKLTCILGWPD